jgi:hypothetical protein
MEFSTDDDAVVAAATAVPATDVDVEAAAPAPAPVAPVAPPTDDTVLKMVQRNDVDALRELLLRQSDDTLVNRVKDWVSTVQDSKVHYTA